jgi:hypothetical protein
LSEKIESRFESAVWAALICEVSPDRRRGGELGFEGFAQRVMSAFRSGIVVTA